MTYRELRPTQRVHADNARACEQLIAIRGRMLTRLAESVETKTFDRFTGDGIKELIESIKQIGYEIERIGSELVTVEGDD